MWTLHGASTVLTLRGLCAARRILGARSFGQLIFALNDAEPFGGAAETRLLQRRYYYHQGSPILCTKKDVKGPADEVESLLHKAPNEPVDCSFAPKVQRLASVVQRGAAAMDELKKLLCARPHQQ